MVANRWFQHRKTEEEEGFDRRFVILGVLGVLSMVGSLSLETINDQTNLKFGRWEGGGSRGGGDEEKGIWDEIGQGDN